LPPAAASKSGSSACQLHGLRGTRRDAAPPAKPSAVRPPPAPCKSNAVTSTAGPLRLHRPGHGGGFIGHKPKLALHRTDHRHRPRQRWQVRASTGSACRCSQTCVHCPRAAQLAPRAVQRTDWLPASALLACRRERRKGSVPLSWRRPGQMPKRPAAVASKLFVMSRSVRESPNLHALATPPFRPPADPGLHLALPPRTAVAPAPAVRGGRARGGRNAATPAKRRGPGLPAGAGQGPCRGGAPPLQRSSSAPTRWPTWPASRWASPARMRARPRSCGSMRGPDRGFPDRVAVVCLESGFEQTDLAPVKCAFAPERRRDRGATCRPSSPTTAPAAPKAKAWASPCWKPSTMTTRPRWSACP
jgi:hypothetical protein